MTHSLRLTQNQYEKLHSHLFPRDGKEAVALLLCGRRSGASRHILTVREIHPVPYEHCAERTPISVTWSTDIIDGLIPFVIANDYSIVKVHSHLTEQRSFSDTDDTSDEGLFASIANLLGNAAHHASVIMLPSGEMVGTGHCRWQGRRTLFIHHGRRRRSGYLAIEPHYHCRRVQPSASTGIWRRHHDLTPLTIRGSRRLFRNR